MFKVLPGSLDILCLSELSSCCLYNLIYIQSSAVVFMSLDVCSSPNAFWSHRLRVSTRPAFADLVAEPRLVFLKSCGI